MKYIYVLITLLIYFNCFSQHKISGLVVDEKNQKMSNAIIQLKDATDDIITYTSTDEKGYYELFVDKTGTFQLECNSWGFEANTNEISIIETTKNYNVNFEIKAKINKLDEVVILGNSAIKEKNDTLSYNLKSFTNGSERNLKDILNKLPGIEIDENGHIKANGKPVDKLLVDGQEFFGDNHQMATENLTAEMIGGVDIYNHYTNNSNIKDIEGSEKTALNIGIKEGYKGKITGNLNVFSGYENRYKAAANLFRFNRKSNLSFIGNLNNTNEETISLMDYFNMGKSIKKEIKNNNISDFSANDDIPTSLLSNDNVSKKETSFGALNFSYFPTSKFKIDGFSILNNNFQKEVIINSNRFLQGSNSFETSDNINAKGNFLFNQTKINTEYKINSKNVFNYSLSIEPNKDNQEKTIEQTLVNSINFLNENQNNNVIKLGHQVSFINRLANNKLLTFNAFHEITSNASNYKLNSDTIKFDLGTNFIQNKNYRENEFGVLGKYAVKAKDNIFTFGASYASLNQSFKSNLNDFLSNNVSLQRNGISVENTISKRKGFWQYSIENKLTYFVSDFENKKKLYYLPKIQLKLELKSTSNITLNYQRQLQFPNANQVYNKSIIHNYYTLNQNNNLNLFKPILSDNFGINYLFIDLFSGTIIYVNVNYNQSKDAITTNSIYQQNYSITNNTYSNSNHNLNANINFERKIKFLKSRIKSNISYSKINGINYLNNIENNYQNNIYFLRFALVSRFKNPVFNYNLGYETQFLQTKYENNSAQINNKIYKPYINFEGNISKAIKYHLSNSYSVFKSQNIERNFFKTDLELSVKTEKSNWEYYLKANDILNLKKTQIIEINLENNIEQTRILSRLSGYIGIGAKYIF